MSCCPLRNCMVKPMSGFLTTETKELSLKSVWLWQTGLLGGEGNIVVDSFLIILKLLEDKESCVVLTMRSGSH